MASCAQVIQDFASDNVMYLELRTTPKVPLHPTHKRSGPSIGELLMEGCKVDQLQPMPAAAVAQINIM